MNYQDDLSNFQKKHQYQSINVGNAKFRYLLCGNGRHTLVFLVGGMGISEMYMNYITELENEYQILTFDYPMEYKTLQDVSNGISELLKKLNIKKAVFIGSSLGGYMAQIFARCHKDQTEGICLFSTAGLDETTIKSLKKSHRFIGVMLAIMKIIPYNWLKPSLIKFGMKQSHGASEEEYRYLEDMFRNIVADYTREFDIHMTTLMIDLIRQKPCTPEEFAYLDGKVLLVFPENDVNFTPEMQNTLIAMMPHPMTVGHIDGGHIATVIKIGAYVKAIREFMKAFS